MNRRTLLSLLTVSTLASAAIAQDRPAPAPAGTIGVTMHTPVDQLPSVKELPDPFTFVDGSRVKSREDWTRRSAELKQLIQTYEYGRLPGTAQVRVKEDPAYVAPKRSGSNADKPPVENEKIDYPEGTKVTSYLVTVGPQDDPKKQLSYHLMVTVPPGKGPFPVIVRGDLCWGRPKPEIAAEIARRGYMLADFDRNEIVPDKKEWKTLGYQALADLDANASAVGAWAWGYHRVIDYLVTRDDVDKAKIAVTGHSRGGKTALLAGLMDERVALTVPNNSGCGGAGCYRYQAPKSEAIENITKNFPHWFQPKFPEFIGKVDRLPFDQHSVKAAIAPRALLSVEALGDLWANPEGSQVTHAAAKEVYDYLGAGDRIAIYYREGKHEQNLSDWQTLMDFADQLFFGKKVERKFNNYAFPDAPKPWSWTAPK